MYKPHLPPHDQFLCLKNCPQLGIGNIWTGRRWPVNNSEWTLPAWDDVTVFYEAAYASGIRMFDTAAAYGLAEQRLGRYFKEHPEQVQHAVLATKWGEEFDVNTERSFVDHSLQSLRSSFKRSLGVLPKIDVLYIHQAGLSVLADPAIRAEMLQYKQRGQIGFTGASISDAKALHEVVAAGLLWFDVLQTSSVVVWENLALLQTIFDRNIAVVVNSPVRKSVGLSPKEAFQKLAALDCVSFVLSGTRTHLDETIGYFT